eukprot:244391-Hanusia_phi.AAC.1
MPLRSSNICGYVQVYAGLTRSTGPAAARAVAGPGGRDRMAQCGAVYSAVMPPPGPRGPRPGAGSHSDWQPLNLAGPPPARTPAAGHSAAAPDRAAVGTTVRSVHSVNRWPGCPPGLGPPAPAPGPAGDH